MNHSHSAELNHLLHRGVAEIISEGELVRLLEIGKPLRLKQGFDPTRPDLHLGHVVGLRKLRQFQELGHQVILVVGDWTAQIGDPSGQSATRSMLSADEVRANAESYMRQFFKIVDRERTQVVWQSEWFGKFSLADVIKLTSKFTVAQMLAREDFAKRYAAGRPIAVTEFLYPLLQAYDSVVIGADVEFGGTDQKFNILVGRELQAIEGQRPQQVFLMPILVGTDGVQKMSKSLGNYIGVEDPPTEMYGKVMSLPDSLVISYFELLTDISDAELQSMAEQIANLSVNPMVLKQRLAKEIVNEFHGSEASDIAAAEFVRIFQRRELPAEIPTAPLKQEWFSRPVFPANLLVEAGLAASRGEARRLIAQGAVRMDGNRLQDEPITLIEGATIQIGRRRFARLVRSD
ncbi:MAG: tyrosine--tRNA ligase [Dehalococcoidia bacterium]|nr:tyrosine--tRNA ligase [Dehalococcoidia bacterium]